MKDAREIGVLYSLTSEMEYSRISRFAQYLQQHGKKVTIIGTYNFRKLPPYYSPKLAYDVIMPNDLDLLLRPDAKFATHFIEQPFDMVINLGSPNDFPLYYLASLSKAGFKLGRKEGIEPWPYDLMIDAHIDDTDELINQIIHYTTSFNMGNGVNNNSQ